MLSNPDLTTDSMSEYSDDELREMATSALVDGGDYERLDFAHMVIHELLRRLESGPREPSSSDKEAS